LKRSTAAIFTLIAAAILAGGYLMLTGPEMKDQPHIRAYQAVMPPTPEGSVPLRNPAATMPTTQQAQELVRGLPASDESIARGKVYYRYYCVFCHGDAGDGRGPVGESYVPPPADLRTAKARGLSDGELLRAMLLGVGHEPVLARVVPELHRPYLVLYVRQFAAQSQPVR
jgi:hypothetical protein